jgi:hypothetical protein
LRAGWTVLHAGARLRVRGVALMIDAVTAPAFTAAMKSELTALSAAIDKTNRQWATVATHLSSRFRTC